MAYIALFAITLCAVEAPSAQTLDVSRREADRDEKYPFVVTFISEHQRACTGTLIAPNWVLTAGECTLYDDEHRLQYGNLSVTPSQAKLHTKIIKAVKHPSHRGDADAGRANQDSTHSKLQLVLVETIPLQRYAHISAIDYKTLTGIAVEHASLEITFRDPDNVAPPLILGQGVVTSCESETYLGISSDGPMMCVAPACDKRYRLARADSGGPLFYGGKVIGVLQGAGNLPVIRYTAVSPFIDWINLVVTQNKPDRL